MLDYANTLINFKNKNLIIFINCIIFKFIIVNFVQFDK